MCRMCTGKQVFSAASIKKGLLVLVVQGVSSALFGLTFLIVIYMHIQQAGLVLIQLYSEISVISLTLQAPCILSA